jgi:hypothetical protein
MVSPGADCGYRKTDTVILLAVRVLGHATPHTVIVD